jgi:3-hydroxyacyl-[acyl-carrier-protein] dehydratase
MTLLNDFFHITATSSEGAAATYTIALNPEHTIYKAHFPGNPITPGVCIVQIIGELLQQRTETSLSLQKVTNLKFISPISPVDNPDLEVSFADVSVSDSEVKAKGSILAGEEMKTKFSLVFNRK